MVLLFQFYKMITLKFKPLFYFLGLLALWPHPLQSDQTKDRTPKPNPLPKVHLLLNWKFEPQFGGFVTIVTQNLDKKHGFQLEITPGGSGTPTIQLLTEQKVDFGIVSGDEMILAQVRQPRALKALWATFQENPQIIMMKKDSAIRTLKDLFANERYTLTWQGGLPYATFLKKKYQSVFKIKTRPYLGGLSVFLNEPFIATQGFETSEPFLVPKGINVTIFPVREEGFNPYLTVLATHTELTRTKPDLIRQVINATKEGWQHYLKDPEAAHQYMLKKNPLLTKDFLSQSATSQKSLIIPKDPNIPLGHMDPNRWIQLIRTMKEAGVIPTSTNITPADIMFSE